MAWKDFAKWYNTQTPVPVFFGEELTKSGNSADLPSKLEKYIRSVEGLHDVSLIWPTPAKFVGLFNDPDCISELSTIINQIIDDASNDRVRCGVVGGICSAIGQYSFNYDQFSTRFSDSYSLVPYFAMSWDKFSGVPEYPIPATYDSASSPHRQYHRAGFWVDEQLELRISLLKHMLNILDKMKEFQGEQRPALSPTTARRYAVVVEACRQFLAEMGNLSASGYTICPFAIINEIEYIVEGKYSADMVRRVPGIISKVLYTYPNLPPFTHSLSPIPTEMVPGIVDHIASELTKKIQGA